MLYYPIKQAKRREKYGNSHRPWTLDDIRFIITIGIASLAGFIGQGGLGSLIFQNITTRDYDAIAAGTILLAVVAITADLILLALQTALNRGRAATAVV